MINLVFMTFLYYYLTFAAHFFMPSLLKKRLRKKKEEVEYYQQKLGIYKHSLAPPNAKTVVIHGASVGETLSAIAIMEDLQKNIPDIKIIFTSITKTSAQLLREKNIHHIYAPLDSPQAVKRFFDHVNPDMIIIMDTEIWPNYIFQAKKRAISLIAVNMRLSPKAQKRWKMMGSFFKKIINSYDIINVQNEQTACFLRGFTNQPVYIHPNIKWAQIPKNLPEDNTYTVKHIINNRRVLLLLSSHAPEEALFIKALENYDFSNLLIVIIPRHPHRAQQVAKIAEGKKGKFHIVSQMGQVALWAHHADITIMGNSFIPKGGGHNIIEPAIYHNALICGPYMQNFTEVVDMFKQHNAIKSVFNMDMALTQVKYWLDHPEEQKKNAQNAYDLYVQKNKNSLGFLTEIKALL